MVWGALEKIDAFIPVKSAKCNGLLLPGVGGHSVHGHEGPGVQTNQPMGERFRLRFDGDEQKLVKISRLGCR